MILTTKQAVTLIEAVNHAARAGIQITVAQCEADVWVYYSPHANLVKVVEFVSPPSPKRPPPEKRNSERYDGWRGLEAAYAVAIAQEIPVGPTPTN